MEAQVGAAGDGEQHALGAFHRGLQQRGVDGLLGSVECAVVPTGEADAHEGGTGVSHHGANVSKVDVDHARDGDEVGNTLHTVVEHLVGGTEGLDDGQLLAAQLHEAVVGDHDERVADIAQLFDAGHGLAGAARALKLEGAGHHANGERAHLLGDGCDDRCCTSTGAAALAGGHEDHVGALEGILNFGLVVLSGGLAHLRVGTSAETAGGLAADVELGVGVGENQRLGIGINRDELDSLEPFFDHAVDGVDTTAADTDDLDVREVVAS